MFLNFFSKTEAGHVLKMFLQFWLISASRSYKLGSYKRKNLESIGVRDGMGGQGQYRVGRGSIGWAGAVLTVQLPKSDFRHIKKAL